jgi:FkbM family methyltransferase
MDELFLQPGDQDRLPAGLAVFRGKPFLFPKGSDIGGLAEQGVEWDSGLREIVSTMLPMEDPVIWDVGANIGASTRQMHYAKPKAHFVVFEPSARFRCFLEANLRHGGIGNVELIGKAVGRTEGTITVYNGLTTGTVVVETGAVDKQVVQITSLDAFFAGKDRPVHFIKIDTDGFDLEVLRGAEDVLRRLKPVIYFEHTPSLVGSPRGTMDPLGELAWLQAVGYRKLVCLRPEGSLMGVSSEPKQVHKWCRETGYGDILACMEGSAEEARLELLLPKLTIENAHQRNAGLVLELQRDVLRLHEFVSEAQRVHEAEMKDAANLRKTKEKVLSKLEIRLAHAEEKAAFMESENEKLREARWWRHPAKTLARLCRRGAATKTDAAG